MTTQTKHRLLGLIFFLLITILVGELSYFFFYRRHSTTNLALPTARLTPSPTPELSNTTQDPPNTLHLTQQEIDNFLGIIPKNTSILKELGLKIVTEGRIKSIRDNTITITPLNGQSPFTIKLNQNSLSKLQIILPDKTTHSLRYLLPGTSIQIETVYSLTPQSRFNLDSFTIYVNPMKN